ncbi:MAG: alkylation response protein AidB-like acyl-CoA dehydrogenase [Kiritimatiellia bacterium]|jgi:alkylation response protein AidB-like acyl-CoA dehydrogenase
MRSELRPASSVDPPVDLSALALGPTEDEAEVVSTVCDMVARFGEDRLDAAAIDQAHCLPDGLLAELADLGLFSLSIPEAYDGAGLTLAGVSEVVAELAMHDRSVAATVGLHLGLGTRGLVAFGSDAIKQEYLPRLASGEIVASFAATEPGAGSDLRSVRTRIEAKGDGLTLNGSKIFVTNGGFADIYTLLVSSPGLGGARRGQSLVIAERTDVGVIIGAEEDKLGLRGSSTVTVDFDDVSLPQGRIIGQPGRGSAQAGHVLAWGRTAMAAGCVGTAQAALDLARKHVSQRVQFGAPLIQHPVVRAQVAQAASDVFAAQSLVRWTGRSDGHELSRRSTSAKVLASRVGWGVADVSLQLHGGSGYIEETGVALMLRDSRVTRIFEGANDVLLGHAAAMELLSPSTVVLQASLGPHPSLAKADAICERVHLWRLALKRRYGMGLLRRARVLHRFGELVVLRDTAIAVALAAVNDPTREALADLALHRCAQRCRELVLPVSDQDAVDRVIASLAD